jgi:hypothetical protein
MIVFLMVVLVLGIFYIFIIYIYIYKREMGGEKGGEREKHGNEAEKKGESEEYFLLSFNILFYLGSIMDLFIVINF